MMRFGQAVRHLPGDRQRLIFGESPNALQQAPQVLALHILHRDEVRAFGFSQVIHPADVPVGDLPRHLELVAEPVDDLPVLGDLGVDELERDLLVDLLVLDPEDASHSPAAELLDDLVAAGEQLPPLEERRRGHHGHGLRVLRRSLEPELRPALAAEEGVGGIIEMTERAADRVFVHGAWIQEKISRPPG